MTLLETSFIALANLLAYTIISNKIVKDTPCPVKRGKVLITAALAIMSIFMGIIAVSPIREYILIIGFIVSILFTYFLYGLDFGNTVLVFVLTNIIIFASGYASIFVTRYLIGNDELYFKYWLLAQQTNIVLLFLIYKYVPMNILMRFKIQRNKLIYGLASNIFIIISIILIYKYANISKDFRNFYIIVLFLIGVFYTNFTFIKNLLKTDYDEKMFKTYKEYLPIIEDLIEEIRYRQHQFDDHIQAIRMLSVTGENLESTVNKMKGYAEDIVLDSKITKLIKLNNRILSGFLYEKYKRAESMGVDFNIIVDDYEFKTNLKDYELVEIMGNLINNAFETNAEDNRVILNLTAEEDMSLIEVKNKYPFLNSSGISQMFMSGYSTKSKDGRGIGLPSVKKIVSNHGGILQVQNDTIDDENYLVFRILLKR